MAALRACTGGLPSSRLSLRFLKASCVSTAFAAKTPPLPCVSAAFAAKTPPLPCASTAFAAKPPPLPRVSTAFAAQKPPLISKMTVLPTANPGVRPQNVEQDPSEMFPMHGNDESDGPEVTAVMARIQVRDSTLGLARGSFRSRPSVASSRFPTRLQPFSNAASRFNCLLTSGGRCCRRWWRRTSKSSGRRRRVC